MLKGPNEALFLFAVVFLVMAFGAKRLKVVYVICEAVILFRAMVSIKRRLNVVNLQILD